MADFKEAGRILARADLEGFYILDSNIKLKPRSAMQVLDQIAKWAGRYISAEDLADAVEGYNDEFHKEESDA